MITFLVAKVANNFFCEKCDYITSRKSSFEKHMSTVKHKMITNDNKSCKGQMYKCTNCEKSYAYRSGLSLHKKKCNVTEGKVCKEITTELVMNIIQQNQEFKELLMEQSKNMMEMSKPSTTITTINSNNNSNNKTFNLQVFLNETCKDAMNLTDFVDSVKLQLSDLENVGEVGYINGISDIIIKNLKALDEHMRPVHCSDLKRKSIYVKDDNKWQKEDPNHNKMKNAIKYIAHKNVRMIPKFREKYPDCDKSDSRRSDQYNKLYVECMGGAGDDEDEKSNKIISKILKEVLIDKYEY